MSSKISGSVEPFMVTRCLRSLVVTRRLRKTSLDSQFLSIMSYSTPRQQCHKRSSKVEVNMIVSIEGGNNAEVMRDVMRRYRRVINWAELKLTV